MSDKETDLGEVIPSTATSQPKLGREDISKIAAEVVAMLQAVAKKSSATTTPGTGEDTGKNSSKGKEPTDGKLQVLSRSDSTQSCTCNGTGERQDSSTKATCMYKM